MTKKIPELTTQDMAAARLLLDKSPAEVAKEVGLSLSALFRHRKTPEFIAYQNQLRADQDKKLEKQSDAKRIVFTRNDAAVRYLRIADDPKATRFEQLKATDSLVALYKVAAEPALASQNGAGEPEKPNIYRPAWMQ